MDTLTSRDEGNTLTTRACLSCQRLQLSQGPFSLTFCSLCIANHAHPILDVLAPDLACPQGRSSKQNCRQRDALLARAALNVRVRLRGPRYYLQSHNVCCRPLMHVQA